MSGAREQFERLLAGPDHAIDLARAALWIAAEEYPDLDVPGYLARLDALADGAARRGVSPRAPLSERVDRLNRFLFGEEGFHGDAVTYYDPRNSYLNEVLDRRTGIPISLSVVYMAVARRLGVDARGISFPGHFLVKCVGAVEGVRAGPREIVVDPFVGITLSHDDCQERLDALTGGAVPLRREHLEATSPRLILARMLSNLKQIFTQQDDLERALACCDRILLLLPDAPGELRDRALVYARLGLLSAAAADLDRFVAVAPEDPFANAARQQRDALRARVGRLH